MQVTLTLRPEEPDYGPWQTLNLSELLSALFPNGVKPGEPRILAIDGRSGSGKTTLAARLASEVSGSAVVHTDDQPASANWRGPEAQATILSDPVPEGCSWFDWEEAVLANILEPHKRGEPVTYRPASWDDWNRGEGAIEILPDCPLLILEGVGAGRLEFSPLVDKSVWVQSDFDLARVRGIARDGEAYRDEAEIVWDKFMAEELPFLAQQKPWLRADKVVLGNAAAEKLGPETVFVSV